MIARVRTREDIVRELADRSYQAGRVTVADPRHGTLHEAMNALLDELEWLDS